PSNPRMTCDTLAIRNLRNSLPSISSFRICAKQMRGRILKDFSIAHVRNRESWLEGVAFSRTSPFFLSDLQEHPSDQYVGAEGGRKMSQVHDLALKLKQVVPAFACPVASRCLGMTNEIS